MAVSFSVSDPIVQFEGNSGDTVYRYTFSVLGVETSFLGGFISFNFVSAESTADASDFSNFSNSYTLNFAAGQTQQTLNILVKGDTDGEADETFRFIREGVFSFTVSGAADFDAPSFSNASFSGTILDDDATNLFPTAINDAISTRFNTAAVIPVLANDSDPDGDSLTIASVGTSPNGTVEIVGSELRFTPTAGFTGDAVFDYTISDDNGGTDTASVTVSVGTEQFGGNGRDSLTGNNGKDLLDGGNGPDVLDGRGGDDLLRGSNGPDTVTGGTGADTFVIARNSGSDTITDFNISEGDKIGLSGLSYGQLSFSSNQILFGSNVLVSFSNGLSAANVPQSSFTAV